MGGPFVRRLNEIKLNALPPHRNIASASRAGIQSIGQSPTPTHHGVADGCGKECQHGGQCKTLSAKPAYDTTNCRADKNRPKAAKRHQWRDDNRRHKPGCWLFVHETSLSALVAPPNHLWGAGRRFTLTIVTLELLHPVLSTGSIGNFDPIGWPTSFTMSAPALRSWLVHR